MTKLVQVSFPYALFFILHFIQVASTFRRWLLCPGGHKSFVPDHFFHPYAYNLRDRLQPQFEKDGTTPAAWRRYDYAKPPNHTIGSMTILQYIAKLQEVTRLLDSLEADLQTCEIPYECYTKLPIKDAKARSERTMP